MPYLHGIAVSEKDSMSASLAGLTGGGVPVVIGAAPINLRRNPGQNVTNVPFLCKTFEEAEALFGYSTDFRDFPICEAMYVFFKLLKVGPVVFINVLSESSNTQSTTMNFEISSAGDTFTVYTRGIVKSTVVIKKTVGGTETTLMYGRDYTSKFDENGFLVISLSAEQTAGDYTVSFASIMGAQTAPSGTDNRVSAEQVIGSADPATGSKTGIQLVDSVYNLFGLFPSVLIAPYGYLYKTSGSDDAVSLALIAKAESISDGMFKAEAVVNLKIVDNNIPTANPYAGMAHAVAAFPTVKAPVGQWVELSTVIAALMAYLDAENGGVPALSISNQKIDVTAIGYKSAGGVEYERTMELSTANALNGLGIVTAINLNGFRTWGNNTAAYPSTSEPKDRWIGSRRFFNWMENRFTAEHFGKVDSPLSYRVIEQLVEDENQFCASLVADGKCAGARIEFRLEDNPAEEILEGKVKFRQYLSPYPPAEYIENVFEYDSAPIVAEFTSTGGEA